MDLILLILGWGFYKAFMFFAGIMGVILLIGYVIVKECLGNPQDFKKSNDIERRRLNRLGLKHTFCDSSMDYTVLDADNKTYNPVKGKSIKYNNNNTAINWNCFDKKEVNRKKSGTCLFREAQCYSCKHRFMWHRLSNLYYEYYFEDTKDKLEYAKCPKCGTTMLLISGELEGIPEHRQGVIRHSIRSI